MYDENDFYKSLNLISHQHFLQFILFYFFMIYLRFFAINSLFLFFIDYLIYMSNVIRLQTPHPTTPPLCLEEGAPPPIHPFLPYTFLLFIHLFT